MLEKHYVQTLPRTARADLLARITPPRTWCTPTPTSPRRAGAEIIASLITGTTPPAATGPAGLDSQLTTYKILGSVWRGISWLTLRQRGKTELARLDALPASAWKTAVIARSGRYRRPRLHEDMELTGISTQVRQIAVKNIGRDEPTLIITNDLTTPGKNLFARYAERMMVENELDAYIGEFHLDALTSGVPLNVDLDTTLTVAAGNLYRRRAQAIPLRARHPRNPVTRLPGRHRHLAHRQNRRHLRAKPAQHTPPSSTPDSPNSKPRSLVRRRTLQDKQQEKNRGMIAPISRQPIRPSRQPGMLSLSVSPPRSADSDRRVPGAIVAVICLPARH